MSDQFLKPSLDELVHHGVLGMKWGQRRTANATDIRRARNRLETKRANYRVQEDKVDTAEKGSAQRAKEVKKLRDMDLNYLKDPDRVIAVRMTRGEKAVAILLGLATVGTASPISLASIAVSSAASRRIEKKQDERQYDKK